MQAEQLTTNLRRAGIQTDEYVFSQSSVNKLARALYMGLRDHALSLPDDEETRTEFLTTRLIETGPGTVKLDDPPGTHDDIVTAVGMLAVDLLGQPDYGAGSIASPVGKVGPRATVTTREAISTNSRGQFASIIARSRARSMPRGVRAISGVPGAYDDPRRAGP
jgi:hypothetical protein